MTMAASIQVRSMPRFAPRADLQVAPELASFIEEQAIPGTGIDPSQFWSGFSHLVREFGPRNAALLHRRDELQSKIDAWHIAHRDREHELASQFAFEGGEVRLSAQLPVHVPDDIGQQLVRGCYWISAPAVEQIKRWRTHWGDGPAVMARDLAGAGLLGAALAGMAPRATPEALKEIARLQAEVMSTGQVIRAAVERALRRASRATG